MSHGRILFSFFAVTSILIGSLLGALSLHSSSIRANAEQTQEVLIVRKSPYSKASPTPTLKPTDTPMPTPTLKSTPTPIQTLKTSLPTSTTASDYILSRINDYRKSNGLSPASSNGETCSFANTRAKEISTYFNHDGFTSRMNDHTLPYPSYHEITENISMNSNYTDVVTQWINSPGHAENMRRDTPFICVVKYGNYYAYEGWKP